MGDYWEFSKIFYNSCWRVLDWINVDCVGVEKEKGCCYVIFYFVYKWFDWFDWFCCCLYEFWKIICFIKKLLLVKWLVVNFIYYKLILNNVVFIRRFNWSLSFKVRRIKIC